MLGLDLIKLFSPRPKGQKAIRVTKPSVSLFWVLGQDYSKHAKVEIMLCGLELNGHWVRLYDSQVNNVKWTRTHAHKAQQQNSAKQSCTWTQVDSKVLECVDLLLCILFTPRKSSCKVVSGRFWHFRKQEKQSFWSLSLLFTKKKENSHENKTIITNSEWCQATEK